MTFLTHIEGWFKKQEHSANTLLHKLLGDKGANALESSAKEILDNEVGKVALTTVQELESNATLSNTDKAAQAASAIGAAAKAAGVDASAQFIALLRELALTAVRHYIPIA